MSQIKTADDLWKNEKLMSLNAELGLSMDALVKIADAMQSQAQQTEPVAWGYAWQCKSVGDWRIEKLGEGCIPPKDTLALYVIPPAPEGE